MLPRKLNYRISPHTPSSPTKRLKNPTTPKKTFKKLKNGSKTLNNNPFTSLTQGTATASLNHPTTFHNRTIRKSKTLINQLKRNNRQLIHTTNLQEKTTKHL
jgi:hypothetical protein